MKKFQLEFNRELEDNIVIEFMAEKEPSTEEILKIAENGDFKFDPEYESWRIEEVPNSIPNIDKYLRNFW